MTQALLEKSGTEFRTEPQPSDREAMRELLRSTDFFYGHEIEVALELLDDRMARGTASDYHFLFADVEGRLAGYVCFGPIPVAERRFDLYWIGVHQNAQGRGLGRQLLEASERRMRELGGAFIYVETSSRPLYDPTRRFYENNAYQLVARIPYFYADDDDRLVYLKKL